MLSLKSRTFLNTNSDPLLRLTSPLAAKMAFFSLNLLCLCELPVQESGLGALRSRFPPR